MYSPCAILKIFFFLSVIFSVPFCSRPGGKRQHGSSQSFILVFPVTILKEPMNQLCLREAISQCLRCAAIHLRRARHSFSQDLSGILWIHLVLWRTPARRLLFRIMSEVRHEPFTLPQLKLAHLSLPIGCKVVHFCHVHQFHVIAG